jgi:4-amino-4-deoxy-L-arabinose transferase-like glycosyltransferase
LKRPPIEILLVTAAISILSLFYFLGVANVPFHPDETTYLFMSQDFDTLLTDPTQLFWKQGNEYDVRQRYRELDPPLPRYMIGIGLNIMGLPTLQVDWNWSKTWDENLTAGAYPSSKLLITGRMAIALFFPFTLIFIYSIGKSLGGQLNGWLALLLFSSNALILLHTRRAMAEGLLLFTITLSLWSMLQLKKHRWLVALPVALAFCAKATSAPLTILGLVSVAWPISKVNESKREVIYSLTLYIVLFMSVTFILNPFIWSDPIHAIWGAMINRQALMEKQAVALQSIRPDQVLNTPSNRILGMIGQLFLTQPATADIGNYINQTRQAEITYFSNPINNLFRNFTWGGLFAVLTVVGFLFAILKLQRLEGDRKRTFSIFLLGTILQFLGLFAALHISWQRYYIPMIPFTCLWIGFAVTQAVDLVTGKFSKNPVNTII